MVGWLIPRILVIAALGAVSNWGYTNGFRAAQIAERGEYMTPRDSLMRGEDPFWWYVDDKQDTKI